MTDLEIALDALPRWKQIPIARSHVVEVARRFKSLRYHESNTFVQWNSGEPRGQTNCYGLLFLIVIELKLMPDRQFWRAWHQGVALVGVPLLLRAYLNRELRQIEPEALDAGDVTLFRWRAITPQSDGEEDAVRRGHHHVGVVGEIAGPRALLSSVQIIQATDTGPNSSGVFESSLATHDGAQIIRAATFPQFLEI